MSYSISNARARMQASAAVQGMPTDRLSSGVALASADSYPTHPSTSDLDPDSDLPDSVIKESLAAAKLRLGLGLPLPPPYLSSGSYFGRSLPPLPPEDDETDAEGYGGDFGGDLEWLPGHYDHETLLNTTLSHAHSSQIVGMLSGAEVMTAESAGSRSATPAAAATAAPAAPAAGASPPRPGLQDLSVSCALELHKGMSLESMRTSGMPWEAPAEGRDALQNTVAHLLGVDFFAEDGFWAPEGGTLVEVRSYIPTCIPTYVPTVNS